MNEGLSAGVVNATTLADLYGVLVAKSMMWIAGAGPLTDEHQVSPSLPLPLSLSLSLSFSLSLSLFLSTSLPLSLSLVGVCVCLCV